MPSGLVGAKELYENRIKRAGELKLSGSKIIGYLCCFPPIELMTAIDLVPYRITGSAQEQITQGDAYLETLMCPYIRSCFDLAVKGKYDFLGGLVVPHSCDSVHRIYDIWRYYSNPAYSHFIDVPHMCHRGSIEFFKRELERFKQSLERYAKKDISTENLVQAINLHNENRALLRELYQFRQHNPPLLSGVEATQILIAGMSLPAKEYNELLESIIPEIAARKEIPREKKPRILIYGSEIDDTGFIELIEQCGADIVMDDLCTGTRQFWHDVEPGDDPLEALAIHYLMKIPCPRTYKPRTGTHAEDHFRTFVPGRFWLGTQEARDFYQKMRDELKYRVEHRIGVVPQEKYRLLWGGGLPPWHTMKLFNYFGALGAVFVRETAYMPYELVDIPSSVTHPLERLAFRAFGHFTCRYERARKGCGNPHVQLILDWLDEYRADGVVMHQVMTCRATTIGQTHYRQLIQKYVKLPVMFLESDIVDVRAYSETQTRRQIDTFLELVDSYKTAMAPSQNRR